MDSYLFVTIQGAKLNKRWSEKMPGRKRKI